MTLPRPALVIRASAAVFVAAMTIAIALYPGGSYFDPHHAGHDFFRNFWCDLLRDTAFNGRPNPLAPRFTQLAMWALGAGLLAFFAALGTLAGPRSALRRVVWTLGVAGVFGMLGVALLPSNHYPVLHGVFVTTAGPLGITAALVGHVAAWRARNLTPTAAVLGVLTLVLACLNVIQYAREFYLRVPSSPFLPAVQKLVTLSLLAWMLAIAQASARQSAR